MATITNSKPGRKWPEVGSPEWLDAMGRTERYVNAYVSAHGMPEIPSPDAAWRELLGNGVILHNYMRAVDPPGVEEWRTIAGELATMAHIALKVGIVPLLIPTNGVAPKHLGALHCLLPGKGIGGGGVAGYYPLERADLIRLETRATIIATRLRGQSGRKAPLPLELLYKRVRAAIEERSGSESTKCYHNDAKGGPDGLLYEIFEVLRPWLVGLEELTDNALRQALERLDPSRKPRVKARKRRNRVGT
jgi:hypothetical protein